MNKAELTQVLDEAPARGSATVVVLDQSTGVISSINGVRVEADENGSTTVWLIVEEF